MLNEINQSGSENEENEEALAEAAQMAQATQGTQGTQGAQVSQVAQGDDDDAVDDAVDDDDEDLIDPYADNIFNFNGILDHLRGIKHRDLLQQLPEDDGYAARIGIRDLFEVRRGGERPRGEEARHET